jgi:hypothetical protein
MNASEYLVTPSGRVFTATVGLAAIGAGAMAMRGSATYSAAIIATTCVLCIVASMFTIGLALADDLTGPTLTLTIGLPFVGGFYVAGLSTIVERGNAIGAAFVVLGLALIVRSLMAHGHALTSTPMASAGKAH